MTKFYRVCYILVAWIFKIGMRIKVVNRDKQPNLKDGACIICSNHISATDPIAIAVALNKIQPHYLAKEQVFKNKLVGWFLRNLGAIPVTRTGNDVGALKTTIKSLGEGKCIGIFPQGTRHPGKNPRDTKIRGGVGMIQAHASARVLPVYISTKENKVKFLRKITVVIGDVITPEQIGKEGKGSAEYERIGNLIFDRICTLGEDYEKQLAEKKRK